jgi:hypothetical protein
VIIISPSAIKLDGSVDFEDEKNYEHKPMNVECPHLHWDGDFASCGIHHYSWFIDTPCHAYTQIGKENSPCRSGEYFQKIKMNIRERFQRVKNEQ